MIISKGLFLFFCFTSDFQIVLILKFGFIFSSGCAVDSRGTCPHYERERERKFLFNDALNTFYLQLYGVRLMVKDNSDSEKGNPLEKPILEKKTTSGQITETALGIEKKRNEMFYLTMHSTHFIYGYMASDIWLRTILIVRKETRCCHIGYSFRLTARVLLYAPSHRQDNTYHGLCYTSCGALAGEGKGNT